MIDHYVFLNFFMLVFMLIRLFEYDLSVNFVIQVVVIFIQISMGLKL